MRRKEKLMHKDTLYKYLRLCKVVRLGIIDKDCPYIVPMNYGYDNTGGKDVLYMHCATTGKKLDLIGINPTVGFEMDINYGLAEDTDPSVCSTKYASIIGTGLVEIIESYTEKITALSILMKELADREIQVFDKRIVDKTTILKLTIKNMTGKISLE